MKFEEPILPYYLPIAGRRRIVFIPFPRVLVLCEMQTVLPRIWICVDFSFSYNSNYYTTKTSCVYIYTQTHTHLNVYATKKRAVVVTEVLSDDDFKAKSLVFLPTLQFYENYNKRKGIWKLSIHFCFNMLQNWLINLF